MITKILGVIAILLPIGAFILIHTGAGINFTGSLADKCFEIYKNRLSSNKSCDELAEEGKVERDRCFECLLWIDQDNTENSLQTLNWLTTISIGFGYFSGLCLAFVGFHLLWNEKFKDHPYWMVAWQCLLIATVQIN